MAEDLNETFRPTLLVGLGGTGIKIAERVYARAVAEGTFLRDRLDVIGLDTDENDLRGLSALERRQTIQISTPDRIFALLDKNQEVETTWFGSRRRFPHEILNMTLLDGAAQIRLLTRLAFTHVVKRGEVQQRLGDAIARIAAVNSRTPFGGSLNIMLCGSLAGATGSGLFLAIALLLGKLCRERSITSEVRGLFLLPDIYVRGGSMLSGQVDNVHANAYAALKELNAINLLAGERGAYTTFDYAYVPGEAIKAGELPFRAITLLDYENTRGSNLGRNLDNYLEMASRSAYMLLFTPVGQKQASVSVNDARAISIAASQGTANLYSGIGVSTIEYPAEEIAEYLTLSVALENLEGDWLRLDRNFFERQRRFEEQRAAGNLAARRPDQAMAFLEDLEQLGQKDRLPFFAEIYANLHPVVRDERDQTEEIVPRYEAYLDAVEAEVIGRFWARERTKLARTRATIDADQLKNLTALVDTVRRLEATLDDDLREIDSALVTGPEDDFINILLTADDLAEGDWRPYHLQTYLIKGGPHLVEVRAFLYALGKRIRERRANLDAKKKRRQLYTQANVFDTERGGDPPERRSPKTMATARDVANRNVLQRLFKGSPAEFQESYAAYVNGSLQAMRQMAEEEIRVKVLDLLADEVAGIERHFAGLFLELKAIFERLGEQARLLEDAHAAEARATDGNVFVCADREAKTAMWAELRTRIGGLRLAGSANRALAREVYWRYREDRRARKTTDFGKLGEAFVRAIVDDFARNTITTDFRSSYDFGIIEAIKRDAARFGGDFMQRLRALVDLVASQSEPFLTLTDPSLGQRSMFWAVHPDVRRDIADPKAFETLFTANQGEQPLIERVFSPRQLMCVNSRVLLELVHLTKLGAGDPKRQALAAGRGRYFDAYQRMVEGLIEEDLDPTAKSPYITPHLDVRWHRPGVLPEISAELGEAQRADTYRAFAIALAQGLIELRDHYGEAKAEFSTVGKSAGAGVAVDLADSHDVWLLIQAFEARSELARATTRYWDDVKRRLLTGQAPTPHPLKTLTDTGFIERILSVSVARDDGEARDRRTRAILVGWMTALDEVGRIVDRDLEAPGRAAKREERIISAKQEALAALTAAGVRRETMTVVDRLFARAFEEVNTAEVEAA